MTLALPLIAGGLIILAAQASTLPVPPVVPDACPRVVLTHSPGLVLRPERLGVVAAVWDSGVVVRAEFFQRPGDAHVVGTIDPSEATTLFEAVKDSPIWRAGGHIVPDVAEYSVFYVRQDGSPIGQIETPGRCYRRHWLTSIDGCSHCR